MPVVINDFEVVPAAPTPSEHRGSSSSSESEDSTRGGTGEPLMPSELERMTRSALIRHLRVRAD